MDTTPILEVRGLSKTFRTRSGWGGPGPAHPVLRDIGFELEKGRTLAMVGPSGAGKTTLGRCLAGFQTADSGYIRIEGRDIRSLPRGSVQFIFQQPAASLNPRFKAWEIVSEPLLIRRWGTARQMRQKACELMEAVGLAASHADKLSREFSGGEQQRLAIARALALEPALLILDEPFSSLDLSLQVEIAMLLERLRASRGLTYILISHDLELVSRLADEVVVMLDGVIVERGSTASLMQDPSHPVTRKLVDACRFLRV